MGSALFQVPLHEGPSIQELASRQVPLIALDNSGPERTNRPFHPLRPVVGVEGPGLPERLRRGSGGGFRSPQRSSR